MNENISYWLMKSEPGEYGIDHLRQDNLTIWDGIRNYQARNFMRSMKGGDQAFFYHSNCIKPCIAGLMQINAIQIIDPTQFDPNSKYFDPKSTKINPRWDCAEVKFIKEFKNKLSLKTLRNIYSEDQLRILKKGNRLSIIPIENNVAQDILIRVERG